MRLNSSNGETDAVEVLMGFVGGVVGGMAGSLAMNAFQWAWSTVAQSTGLSEERGTHQEQRGGQRRQARQDPESDPATVKTAAVISNRIFHHELSETEKKVAGPAVHYTYGALVGGIYGAAAEVAPVVTLGAGTAYATAVFVLGDEIAVPALRLSKPPTQHPFSTHAYAFASHLVYGLTLEAVRRGVRSIE